MEKLPLLILLGLDITTTITFPNIFALREMMSRCPKVIGSKLPGQTAIVLFIVRFLLISGDIDFSVWTVSGLKKNPFFMGKNPFVFERKTMCFFGNRLAETKILYAGTFVNIHGERVPVFNVQTVNHGKYFDGESVDHFYNLNTFQREFKGGLKKWKNLR
jgi:hypothetical protein